MANIKNPAKKTNFLALIWYRRLSKLFLINFEIFVSLKTNFQFIIPHLCTFSKKQVSQRDLFYIECLWSRTATTARTATAGHRDLTNHRLVPTELDGPHNLRKLDRQRHQLRTAVCGATTNGPPTTVRAMSNESGGMISISQSPTCGDTLSVSSRSACRAWYPSHRPPVTGDIDTGTITVAPDERATLICATT
jgi:hypothetical protein